MDERFAALHRLFGPAALDRLARARVAVVGVGGVGSWAVEALVRSGVGHLTLIDPDVVCPSNLNRQIPALQTTLGRPKVEVLAERARLIHPAAMVVPLVERFTAETAAGLLDPGYDWVIDAIDRLSQKCLLLAECRRRGQPVVCSGSAGAKLDPGLIRVADLSRATYDQLLYLVRKKLRTEYAFPREGRGSFGIPAVFSTEIAREPAAAADLPEGPEGSELPAGRTFGSAAWVTGSFGLAAAGVVLRRLIGDPAPPGGSPPPAADPGGRPE